jgi:hypothetical protein
VAWVFRWVTVGLVAAGGCQLRRLMTLSCAFAFCSSGFPARAPACKTRCLRFICTMVWCKRTAEIAGDGDRVYETGFQKSKAAEWKVAGRRGVFEPRMDTNFFGVGT